MFAMHALAIRSLRSVETLGRRYVPATSASIIPQLFVPVRSMAEKAGKTGKKPNKPAGSINLSSSLVDLTKVDEQMRDAADTFGKEIAKLRVGKISPAILDGVRVTVGDIESSIDTVGQVAVKDPQTLVVTCFDPQSAIAVEKAVRNAEALKLTPARDGNLVRISLPKMTKEYRESMVKLARQSAENMKVRVRRVRQKGVKLVRDEESVSQDDIRRMEEMVQALCDKHSAAIDALADAKAKELMGSS